ncbi:DUF6542 domain-containing protein [Lentzea sp. BCCO 10_0061]|uniref:DUF6542 domain-containing protein n=1 Tax=Lentzea sokolovensis TaxID=3095429 RepID=A0ABU4VBN9_9PSEU|nr:DUF6542 domain-containing protein [Lentzea sp. BCCO 10_0061]MDX8148265.1 DUF6542 domain-containing protein [Lentzea sp. BCCO 10_0061]
MSALRERSAAFDDDDVEDYDAVPWNYRAIFGEFKGIPWWAAILAALVPAFIGAFIDINSSKTVGWTFNAVFFLGALAAILLVQRRSLFGPMVQPPLILAITVPLLVLFTGGIAKGGLTSMALGLGRPLIDSFPVMAVTTAVTVGLGILRIVLQKDPNRPSKDEVREAKAEIKERSKPVRRPREEPEEEERPRRPRAERAEGTPARRPRPEGAPARRPRPEGAARGERPAGQRRPRPPREDR